VKVLTKLRCEMCPTSRCNLEIAQKVEYLVSRRGHTTYICLLYYTVVATPFRSQVHLDSTAVNRCKIARLYSFMNQIRWLYYCNVVACTGHARYL